ncbi:MAG: flagellar assembly protein FliW [Nautiliaceae bacterium]|jgi:flagellar assembly factor FliW
MKFKVVLPILGFEDVKEYELVSIDDNFYQLKNEEKDVCFTLINPFLIRNDYGFEITKEEQKALKIKDDTNFLVLNIMIVKEPFIESTVNFAAPLMFNVDEKLMGQVILDKSNYGLTEPLKNFVKSKQ